MSKFKFIFGCRSPTSKYARDGAFIIMQERESNARITGASFENGMGYIGYPTYDEGIRQYKKHIDSGWKHMSVDDLDDTAIDKNQIDEQTLLVIT